MAKAFPRVAYPGQAVTTTQVSRLILHAAKKLNLERPVVSDDFAYRVALKLTSAFAEASRRKGVPAGKLEKSYSDIGTAAKHLLRVMALQQLDDPFERAIAVDFQIALGEFTSWFAQHTTSEQANELEDFKSKLQQIVDMADQACAQIKGQGIVYFGDDDAVRRQLVSGAQLGKVIRWKRHVVEAAIEVCRILNVDPTLSREEVGLDVEFVGSGHEDESPKHTYAGNLLIVVRLIEKHILAGTELGFGVDATCHDTLAKLRQEITGRHASEN